MSDRSASPVRDEPKAKKQKTGGFKWKDSKPKNEQGSDSRDSGRLDRGYRNRSPRRDSYRDREEKTSEREPRRDQDASRRDDNRRRDEDRSKKADSIPQDPKDATSKSAQPETKLSKPKKPKAPVSNEPMIIVNINDRLGTKAAIPCLASDSVKAFKAIVAAHIGRQPHEIMLKRQGERPFKDQLTLQDYGVSNGVQLDLELDTGD